MSDLVAERVRKVREHRGWSQKELAKRATVHHVVLNRLENGHKAGVHAETIRLLAVALDCSTDYLMGLTDDPRPRKRRKQADKQGDFWPTAAAQTWRHTAAAVSLARS
jgi:transcriptional regulator with XRE-family HTH domain